MLIVGRMRLALLAFACVTSLVDSGNSSSPRRTVYGTVTYKFCKGLLWLMVVNTRSEFHQLEQELMGATFQFEPFKKTAWNDEWNKSWSVDVAAFSVQELIEQVLRPLFYPIRQEGKPLAMPPMFREEFRMTVSYGAGTR